MLNVDMKPLISALVARFGQSEDGLILAIDLAVIVATADGTIDQKERAALGDSLAAIMGGKVAPTVARHLVSESKQQIAAAGVAERARAIGELLGKHDAVAEGLRVALAIAYASEGLSADERARIDLVASAAGAPAGMVEELSASMKPA